MQQGFRLTTAKSEMYIGDPNASHLDRGLMLDHKYLLSE